jgi:hypothetical protein
MRPRLRQIGRRCGAGEGIELRCWGGKERGSGRSGQADDRRERSYWGGIERSRQGGIIYVGILATFVQSAYKYFHFLDYLF